MTLAPSRMLGPRLQLTDFTREYSLPSRCENPLCTQPGTESHHIEPRSRTAGPKDWILIDTFLVRNKVRVCPECHLKLTGGIGGHKAKLVWDGGWAWYKKEGDEWIHSGWVDELPELRETAS